MPQPTLNILSKSGTASLTLTRLGKDTIRPEFVTPLFSAAVPQVWLLSSLDPVPFFRDLAASWRGWQGDRTWESLEQQLTLTAMHDSLGHISLRVRLHENPGRGDWVAEGTLELEAGQLKTIARAAEEALGAERPA